MAVSKLPDIEDFEESKQTILNFINSETNCFKHYWMLLNNEQRYYTIFHRHNWGDMYAIIIEETLPDVLIECLQNIGKIKMFETIDNDHIECWVETPKDGCVVYMLFPYDEGVIEVK